MDGLVLEAKYSFMPNRIGGCGIQNHSADILEYGSKGFSDKGLSEILKTFEVAYPYLRFIANENNITDPFDARVVEAYWLGNSLLDRIDKVKFYRWCFERYSKKVDSKAIKLLVGKVPLGALPHHSFHVFNSYLRNTNYAPILHYINECLITCGTVKEVSGSNVIVEHQPITFGIHGLNIGKVETKKIRTKIGDKGFVKAIKPGDLISFHWSWACDRINDSQAKALDRYTKSQLKLFNIEI